MADLERVVEDSIRRYEFFRDRNAYFRIDKLSSPLHALCLLAELEAVDSLPVVLRLLRQGEELLNFWFDTQLDEVVWEVVYHLGQQQLPALRQFVMEPDNYEEARTIVCLSVAQMAVHNPERRGEVLDWHEDLFRFFIEHEEDERIIDTDLISYMIAQLEPVELKTTIPILYERGLVEPQIAGRKEYIMDATRSGSPRKRQLPDIYTRYKVLVRYDGMDIPVPWDESDLDLPVS